VLRPAGDPRGRLVVQIWRVEWAGMGPQTRGRQRAGAAGVDSRTQTSMRATRGSALHALGWVAPCRAPLA